MTRTRTPEPSSLVTCDRGRCLCGQVRFRFDPRAVLETGLCHCEGCRRATGAPVTGWFAVRRTGWRWWGTPPRVWRSGPKMRRHFHFCGRCGSPLASTSDRRPDEIRGLAAALDDPGGFTPQVDLCAGEAPGWLALALRLPQRPQDD